MKPRVDHASSTPAMVDSQGGTSVYLLDPVEILSGAWLSRGCFDQLHAKFSPQSKHTLAADIDAAALIIAPIQGESFGPCFEPLRQSRVYRRNADRVIVYSPGENQFPAVRGSYPAVKRQ